MMVEFNVVQEFFCVVYTWFFDYFLHQKRFLHENTNRFYSVSASVVLSPSVLPTSYARMYNERVRRSV